MENRSFIGNIDGISGNALFGWAADLAHESSTIEVSIYCSDDHIGTIKAVEYRADLEDAGIGDGRHGFRVNITSQLIEVVITNGGQFRLVPKSQPDHIIASYSLSKADLQKILTDRIKCKVETTKYTEITGWCFDTDQENSPVWIGLFTGDQLVATTLADIHRIDLSDAGLGNGCHGFSLLIPIEHQASLRANRERVTVRHLSYPEMIIAVCDFDFPSSMPASDFRLSRLREMTLSHLIKLKNLAELAKPYGQKGNPTKQAAYDRLFRRINIPGEFHAQAGPSGLADGLSGFVDFSRHRMRQDVNFDTSADVSNVDHFLKWYLQVYCKTRAKLRAPLSNAEIEYLNSPVLVGGQRFTLTRAAFYFIFDEKTFASTIDLNDQTWYTRAVYWWAVAKSRELYVEDCLVPESYAILLRSVSMQWYKREFPLSVFMELFFNDSVQLHFLDAQNEQDRLIFLFYIMLLSIDRPDYLRYVPSASIQKIFHSPDGGKSLFNSFISVLAPASQKFELSWEQYAGIIEGQGFDAVSNTFGTISASGNRVGSAALAVPTGDPVDVQLIGPFAKASGLGQATRLSASIIANTGLSYNFANFGLDNPAPEGFSNGGSVSGYSTAKINLIHLNAESIPLAFAYEPDVFTNAYNIGYFYWELDSPASCHYLALSMLDEVWVSTDYGVQIYARHCEIPVTNVSMCFENVPEITREIARSFVNRRFGLNDNNFVFLVAFDSFSFVQRKNPVGVLWAFQIAFRDMPEVRLVVKTQNRDSVGDPAQLKIWAQIDAIVSRDSRIIIMNETLSYNSLLELKQGSDCYISLHKSEGWGFGMIEAMNLRVPVVCTAYSGNLEFCSDSTAWLVDYKEVELYPDDYIFVRRGQKWAEPDIDSAAKQLLAVYSDSDERARKVEAAWANVRENFSAKAVSQKYGDRFKEILRSL